MTLLQAVTLFLAAVLGGTLNSVAGGGSFITFPTLLVTGVLPKSANATSTVALWPGSVASAGGYRHSLAVKRPVLRTLVAASLIGGILGAVLLLLTPQSTFLRLVPYLLLVATLLFAFGGHITARLPKRTSLDERQTLGSLAPLAALQLVIATYGGFFGGGIGILMLAAFALMGMEHIHSMNALKNILASCINGVAVVTFILAGVIAWPQALVMIVGAIVGGYGAAIVARKIDPRLVRRFVIAVGLIMTVYFFVRP
jgi:uncharacterized membrane protein YfcA